MLDTNKQAGSAWLPIVIVVLILVGTGTYLYLQSAPTADNSAAEVITDQGKDLARTNEAAIMADKKADEANSLAMNKNEVVTDDKMAPKEATAEMTKKGLYLNYSTANFELNKNQKRVLFFHAKWCPTCKAANADFEANLDKLPAGVVLLKTDYDTESMLKKQYGVTYQHTFVLVDSSGQAIKKWNGGALDQLIANTL